MFCGALTIPIYVSSLSISPGSCLFWLVCWVVEVWGLLYVVVCWWLCSFSAIFSAIFSAAFLVRWSPSVSIASLSPSMACVWTRSASAIIASSIPFSFVVSLYLLWLSPCGGYTGGSCTTRCSMFSPFRLFSISLTCLLHSFAVFPILMSFMPAIMIIVVLVACSDSRILLHVVVSSRVGIHVCVILVCSFLSRWGWILWLLESPTSWTVFLGSSFCLFLFVCWSAYFCLSALSWCSSTLILVALSSATSWSVRLSFSSALFSLSSFCVSFFRFLVVFLCPVAVVLCFVVVSLCSSVVPHCPVAGFLCFWFGFLVLWRCFLMLRFVLISLLVVCC